MGRLQSAVRTLASYIPDWLAGWVQEEGIPREARSRRVRAAVLLADVQGFTGLSEALARQGPVGVEELSERLTSHFGKLVDAVARSGGDVVKLGGDSLLALWVAEGDLGQPTSRAVACAEAIQEALRESSPSGGGSLATRIGISAGEVELALLGGVEDQWESTVAGPALREAAEAEKSAPPGSVGLAPGVQGLLEGLDPLAPRRRPALAPGLEMFVPLPVRHRLDSEGTSWLAELRRLTILFAHLPDLHEETPLGERQAMVETLQRLVFSQGGSVNKLAVDDKGTLLLAVFGLPPHSYEEDAVQALRAGRGVAEALHCSVGVASGLTFCGTVGNDRRREYTVLGSVVNLAARLMAAAPGDVLCDLGTRSAARLAFRFEALDPVRLKGLENAQAVYRPAGETRVRPRASAPLVGRARETALFEDLVREARSGAGTRVLLVDGEAGIGKSRLLEEWSERLRQVGLDPLWGEGSAVERATPYHAWSRILAEVLDLGEDPESRRQRVVEVLSRWPDLARLAPLLDDILPLDLGDNDLTAAMQGDGRSHNTLHLVVEILRRFRTPAAERPLVVLLDDTHWFDSASWFLTHAVATRVDHALLVVAGRPLDPPRPAALERLERLASTSRLVLDTLAPEEALELVRRRLGVAELPAEVAALIASRAEGNPFFSEEIALELRDSGSLHVAGGRCEIAPGASLDVARFPGTVQGVLTSRIDRLDPTQRMVLKVASVVGRTFLQRLVESVFPLPSEVPRVPACLETLERLGLTPLHVAAPDTEYLFKHALIREVAYDLMLFAHRRGLHAAVAAWYEKESRGDAGHREALLAEHWEKAGERRKAVEYLSRAGERALRTGANREAAGFFGRLLALTSDDPTCSRRQRGLWERRMGTACFHLGEHDRALEHHARAIRLLGQPVPRTFLGFGLAALGALLRQAWHRGRLWRRPEKFDEASEEVSRAWGDLSEVFYFEADSVRTVCAGVQRLNYAERAGPGSRELPAGLGAVSVILSFCSLHGWADAYAVMAEEEALRNPDADCRSYGLLCAGMHHVGMARWQKAEEVLTVALELVQALGIQQRVGESSVVRAFGRYYSGRLEEAIADFNTTLGAGMFADNDILREWGLSGRAGPLLLLGRLEESRADAERALAILAAKKDPTEQLRSLANLALGALRQGDRSRARERAFEALGVLRRDLPQPVAYHPLDGYAHTCQVFLELAEETGDRQSLKAARQAFAYLRSYAACFPIGRPAADCMQGGLHWLAGRTVLARKHWEKSLSLAEEMRTPYAEGRATFELGRHLERGDPRRAALLDRAAGAFGRVGAVLDLRRVEAER